MRVNVFFYGLFMDEALLRSKGIDPKNVCVANVTGYSLVIGNRATVIADPLGRVYGMLMSITHKEIDSLYSEESLKAYRPEPVIAYVDGKKSLPALCFNLVEPPSKSERNPEYAVTLKKLALRIGLPEDYIISIR